MKRTLSLAGGLLLCAAAPALAHTGSHAGAATGLAAGLAHPITGLDHLAAMLAVGLWAAFALPSRAWLPPLAFVAAMAVGALLSTAGIALPMVETIIALSVLTLGLMTAVPRLAASGAVAAVGTAACAAFALFHGHAHGTEAHGAFATYLLGFAVSTAVLHGAGVLAGLSLARVRIAAPVVGGGLAVLGLTMIAG